VNEEALSHSRSVISREVKPVLRSAPFPPEDLPGGLVLRHVVSDEDMEAVGRLLGKTFSPTVADQARAVLENWPGLKRSQCLIVEDPGAPPLPPLKREEDDVIPRVVSTLGLIPRTWSLEGVVLRIAQLEFVATDSNYRNKGLVAALSRKFDEAALADGYLLAGVLGIPYFYSKFGYSYTTRLGASVSLAAAEVKKAVEDDPLRDPEREFHVRPAAEEDLPDLISLWDEWGRGYALKCLRDRAVWECLIRNLQSDEHGKEYVVTESGRIAGLFGAHFSSERCGLFGVVTPDRDTTLAAIRWVAAETLEKGAGRVFLSVSDSPVHDTALSLGGRAETPYAWQVKIYDHRRLLETLRPVLEERLAASPLRGLTHDLLIDIYRSKLTLKWKDGRLEEIAENPVPGPLEQKRVRIPPEAFVRLVLGCAAFSELMREQLDVVSPRPYVELMEILFPRLRSWTEP